MSNTYESHAQEESQSYCNDLFYHCELIRRCRIVDEICCRSAEKIKRLCKLREADIDTFERTKSDRDSQFMMQSSNNSLPDFSACMDQSDVEIAREVDSIYSAIVSCCSVPGLVSELEVQNKKYADIGQSVFGIEAKFCEKNIIIRLPLLARRPRNCTIASSDHMSIYAEDVRRAMQKTLPEFVDQLATFAQKTLSIFYVYNDTSKSIPDSDNRDTKCVIDAITSFLPYGDSGLSCDFSMSAIVLDNVSEGTYIVVSPGKQCFQTQEKLEKMIRSCF